MKDIMSFELRNELLDIAIKKGNIDAHKLVSVLMSQLRYCSEQARKTGEISQEQSGRIFAVNAILRDCFDMTWEETDILFKEYGLTTDIISK